MLSPRSPPPTTASPPPRDAPAADAPIGDSPNSAPFLALAAVALGQALQVASGHVHPVAVAWLTLAFVAVAVAVRPGLLPPGLPPQWHDVRRVDRLALMILAVGLVVQAAQLVTSLPAMYLSVDPVGGLVGFRAGVVAATAFALGAALARGRSRARLFALFIAAFVLLGAWILRHSPDPRIDVFVIHRGSVEALLRGENPYALTFPVIYPTTVMYGPGQTAGDHLTFGYCYPPLTLLLAVPGHVLAGDYRLGQLAAMALSAVLVATLGGNRLTRVGVLAAAVLVSTPRVYYVLEQGWTDAYVGLFFVALVHAALHRPRLLPVALGLFLGAKQYTFFAIPLAAALLFPSPGRALRAALPTALVWLAPTLPFVLWDARAYAWGVWLVQFASPFRADALSYLAWLKALSGVTLPSVIGFAGAAAAVLYGIVRAPRSALGFSSSMALTYLVFYAFNKQAFCNYYFFVLGLIAVALGCFGERVHSHLDPERARRVAKPDEHRSTTARVHQGHEPSPE